MLEKRVKLIGTNGIYNIKSLDVLQNAINEFLKDMEYGNDINVSIQEVTNYNTDIPYNKCLIGVIEYTTFTSID